MSIEIKKNNESMTIKMWGEHRVKFDEIAEKWFFKNNIGLMEFMMSLVALNEGKSFQIKMDGRFADIAPSPDLVNRQRANH